MATTLFGKVYSRLATLFVALFILALSVPAHGQVQERIISYHSEIVVNADSSMLVTETIRVIAAGDQIKRGIYRDFPIAYEDAQGRRYLVGFDLLGVTRNGNPEPHHIERGGNGLRVYIGEEDVFIPGGEHEYQITYTSNRQLGYFPDHDELYWNVTGNGWVFPIESASATVTIPGEIRDGQVMTDVFTGAQGSIERNATSQFFSNNTVNFSTTQPLRQNEGLTIVVGWPKGIVAEPTTAENFWATIKNNLDYIVAAFGLVMVLVYYFFAWHKRGRDPRKGAIIAQYESPNGLSPAMVRFVQRMGADSRAFAASVISMGVKGWLTVSEEKGFLKSTKYTLAKKADGKKTDLSAEEKILYDELFKSGESIKLESKNNKTLYGVQNKFITSLKNQAGSQYFTKNLVLIGLGVAASGAVLIAVIISAATVRFGLYSPVYYAFWPVFIIALLAINIIFGWLIRAYTVAGRKLADEIEGFKMFLNVTEKDRLAFHNPPERTPELFEKMLPYALALGVEHQWAQQFASVFANLQNQGTNYAPVWYYGSLGHFSADDFASRVGSSFAGAVASASAPPGSSSGMGGGSSGGGGGGGGGGGW